MSPEEQRRGCSKLRIPEMDRERAGLGVRPVHPSRAVHTEIPRHVPLPDPPDPEHRRLHTRIYGKL